MNKKEFQPISDGKFNVSLKDISDIMTRISEEDEKFDREKPNNSELNMESCQKTK